jgi:endogenous inhibitor of DNA gyrase (YacG/DUF329 family)
MCVSIVEFDSNSHTLISYLPFKSKQCIIADFDADAAENKPIASQYGVSSYPTIKFFPKGNDKSPIDYNQGRSEADFVSFLNEHCGTHRAPGGGLNDVVRIGFSGYVGLPFSSC